MTEELNIENVSIAQLENEIKTVSDRYNTYFQTRNNISTVRERFVAHYRLMHDNIDIHHLNCGSVHVSKFTESADSYADLVRMLAPFISDTKEARIVQLVNKFTLGAFHFKNIMTTKRDYADTYNLSKQDLTIEDIIKELETTSSKKIVLKRYALEDKYRNRDIIAEIIELMQALFNIDLSYDLWDVSDLGEHQDRLNSKPDSVSFKLHLNGNIYIALKDPEDRAKLVKYLGAVVAKQIKRHREN